jgi:hypothetical protein
MSRCSNAALSLARATGAHLTFFHVRIDPSAAAWLSHADFVQGSATHALLGELQREAAQRAIEVRQ